MTKVYQKKLVTSLMRQWKNLDVKVPQVSHVNEDSDPIDIALNAYVNYYINKPTECNFSEVTPNYI